MERTAKVKKIFGEKYRETGKDHGLTKSKKRDKKIKKRKSFSFFYKKKRERIFSRVTKYEREYYIFKRSKERTKIDKSLTKKITKKSQKQIIK